ncbi:MAG: hypothetical protein LBB39_03665 [Mycoplasmataceae bacterium]|nr:hypothetical protein [Mycoplasmataceae bacterium]
MAKKVINKENNKLASSSKIDFDIDEFFNILGKKENIKSIVSNYTSVKIEFFPPFVWDNKINPRFKIKGCFCTNKTVTLLFGDNAQAISAELNKKLNK